MKKTTLILLLGIVSVANVWSQGETPKFTFSLSDDKINSEITFSITYALDEADAAGKKVYVDWGDGSKVEMVDRNQTPIEISAKGNYKGGSIKVYAPKAYQILNLAGLVTLDVANSPELEKIYITSAVWGNPEALKVVDFTRNTKLKSIQMQQGAMVENLDLSGCTDLEEFIWVGGRLLSLDLSNSPKLNELWVSRNCLMSIKVSPQAPLTEGWRIEENLLDACALNEFFTSLKDYSGNANSPYYSISYDTNPGYYGADYRIYRNKNWGSFDPSEQTKIVNCGSNIVPIEGNPAITLDVTKQNNFYSFQLQTLREMNWETARGGFLIQMDWGDGIREEFVTGSVSDSYSRGNVIGYSKGNQIKIYLENKAVEFRYITDNQNQPGDGGVHISKADFSNNDEISDITINTYFGVTNATSDLNEVLIAPDSYNIMYLTLNGNLSACQLNDLYSILPEAMEDGYMFLLGGEAATAVLTSNTSIITEKAWSINNSTTWEVISGDGSADCSNGLWDVKNTASFTLQANPVISEARFSFESAGNGANIVIIDLTGKTVASEVIASGATEAIINVSSLSKGVYMARYADGNGKQGSLKLVK